jgi:gliding motility-associated-like protein
MWRKCLFIVLGFFTLLQLNAAHLKGGWIQYEYLGDGAAANSSRYRITVRQYLDCASESNPGQRDPEVFIGIFNSANNSLFNNITVPRTNFERLDKSQINPCITGNPKSCYLIDVYTTTVDLPNNQSGYTIAVQRCCRINGIANVIGPSQNAGITYSTTIPGVINSIDFKNNNSPSFSQRDTVIICFNSPFIFDFSATDSDGDSLSYSFCEGLNGGGQGQGTGINSARPNPPANPPYNSIAYQNPYSEFSPIGKDVTINSITGLISGIAPTLVGDYVLGVCASEFRNGILIGRTKKEIHITVADCSLSAADLKPTYISCNGFTLSFQNESTSSVSNYLWDFGVTNSTSDISTNPTPTYTYADTGTYRLTLRVTNTGGCQDSAFAEVRIYPGFAPDIQIDGTCYLNEYTFKDATFTRYGNVNSWKWNFGDNTTLADTSLAKDSSWKYAAPTNTNIKLIVTNSKGCIDSITKPFLVLDRPSLNLAFKDTLICSIDTLPLLTNVGAGTITWTPDIPSSLTRISNRNIANPLVYPIDTTRYIVTINNNGCINQDTVTVNVLDFISVDAGAATSICRTDTIQLQTISDALSYQWTNRAGTIVSRDKFPKFAPLQNEMYYVSANLGYCQARDSVRINVSPYPEVRLGPDTVICFGNRLNLPASMVGASFQWSPTNSMINSTTLNPLAGPSRTTAYTLTVSDTLGCNKSVTDTILVRVVQPLSVNAGRDTVGLPDQPIQLRATGVGRFSWSPSTGLNNTAIANPIAILPTGIDSITYTVRLTGEGGCFAEDQMTIRVFADGPQIFVPSGFTPNGDGKNEILRPVTVGITRINYFTIFNRWGQRIFTTAELNKGWDGTFNGEPQPAGTYVFQVEGTDYLGKRIYKKGTAVLIR